MQANDLILFDLRELIEGIQNLENSVEGFAYTYGDRQLPEAERERLRTGIQRLRRLLETLDEKV